MERLLDEKRNKELITLSDATYDAENEVTKDHKIKKKLDELDKESNHMEYIRECGEILLLLFAYAFLSSICIPDFLEFWMP